MANPTAQAVAAPPAKPPVAPPPAPPTESVTETTPEEAAPEETAPEEVAPQVERVNMSGLVLEKTQHPDGKCKTEVLKEPMIAPELVRATRKLQQARGY